MKGGPGPRFRAPTDEGAHEGGVGVNALLFTRGARARDPGTRPDPIKIRQAGPAT